MELHYYDKENSKIHEETLVKASGLDKVYKNKIHAVKSLTFTVNKVMAIVGPNGAGKSTLHSMLGFSKRRS